MSSEFIKYAFVAGELSPSLYGRSDFEKYDLGLAEAMNYFVDYRGGLSSRAGMQFVDFVKLDEMNTKYVPFKYAPDLANTYVILFGHLYVRFIQDGAYVVEDDVLITDVFKTNPASIVAAAHGYAVGDWFYISGLNGASQLNGRLLVARTVAPNSLTLEDVFGNAIDGTLLDDYVSGGVMNRVYTIASPYTSDALVDLRCEQRRDYVRLTHALYPVHNLIRTDHTDWVVDIEPMGTVIPRPGGLTGAASAAGAAQVGFMVTAVIANGNESIASDMLILTGIVNYSVTAGSVALRWTAVAGAKYYNVYRTNISPSVFSDGGAGNIGGITKGDQVGYVGRAYGPTFTDPNIVPDFTRTPPNLVQPFSPGAIEHIEMVGNGSGWSKDTTVVSVDGPPGAGFIGLPVVDDNGAIISVKILKSGSGYVNPVVSFSGGGGSGGSALATATPLSGTYPTISVVFQQRQMYAATLNDPLTIWGSQPGLFNIFDVSSVVADSDGFSFEVDSKEVAPLLHMVDVRGGLLTMSQTGVWLLRSSSLNNTAVTPTQALADPQSYRGVSEVVPLVIDNDVLYIEGKSVTVRLLTYNDVAKSFIGQDMSILSNHLFGTGRRVKQWDYAQNPHNLIVARREDGAFLMFTLVKEQDVYAWTPGTTQGTVSDVCVVHENGKDSVYFMVQRHVNGRLTKFIERFAPREFSHVEEAFCVDSGLQYVPNFPEATLTPEATTGNNVLFTASVGIFDSSDVGSFIRIGGGLAEIVTLVDTLSVRANILRDIVDVIPEKLTPRTADAGFWTLDAPFTVIGGLWHLIGETVKVLGNGNVMADKVVNANGQITLEAPVTRAVVGLKFTCQGRSLPMATPEAVIEGKRKSVAKLAVRLHDTRGLKVGGSLTKLRPMKERTTEPMGQPTLLQRGFKYVAVDCDFNENGQTYFVQDEPLPATILGFITDVDLGDNPDPRK